MVKAQRRYSQRRPPAYVKDFLERTYPNAPGIDDEMGWLKGAGISRQNFKDFCRWFADGLIYVQNRFPDAPAPKRVEFYDGEEKDYAEYDPNTDVIRINRNLCRDVFKPDMPFFADHDKTIPVTPKQFTVLVGVEEAYHHNQHCAGAKSRRKYMHRCWEEPTEHYEQDPIEQDAARFVLKAARKIGYISNGRSR